MSMQARIDLFGILCAVCGWGFGYVQCYVNQRDKARKAQERAEAAYRRYWNGYDGDEF
jgi:hypothetical protein